MAQTLDAEDILNMVMTAMQRATAETEAAIQRLAAARLGDDIAALQARANQSYGGSLALLALVEQVENALMYDGRVVAQGASAPLSPTHPDGRGGKSPAYRAAS